MLQLKTKPDPASCVVCGTTINDKWRFIMSARDTKMLECPTCRHIFDENQEPHMGYNFNQSNQTVVEKYTVARIHLKHSEDGHIQNKQEYGSIFGGRIEFAEPILSQMFGREPERQRKPRILDIGVGASGSLRYFEDLGFESYGLDTDDVALNFQQDLCGNATLKKGFFPETRFDEKFDAFIAFHVLEHVPDPVGFLKDIRSQASGDGALLFFEVPYIVNQRNAQESFTTWPLWGATGVHLHQYSQASMARSLADAGWTLLGYRDPFNLRREVITGVAVTGFGRAAREDIWRVARQENPAP